MRRSAPKAIGLFLGALGGAAAAQAADLPSRTVAPIFTARPVINIDDWSGVYVGTTFGYGFNQFHTRQGAASNTKDVSGQLGGALVGYNYQVGHYVFGIEGSIDDNVIRGDNRGGGLVPIHQDTLYDIRFRGILGYEFGRFMPFISGGGVLNESYMSGITGPAPSVPDYFGRNNMTVGWTIGGGLEYKFYPQELFPSLPSWLLGPVTLRGEYMYQSLPTQTYQYGGTAYRVSQDSNIIRAALIYRFGDNPPRPYADSTGQVNWAGGYGGIIGGYGSPDIHTRAISGAGLRLAAPTLGADGGLGGIYAGTNFMFGRTMLGIDGTTAFTSFTGRTNLPVGPGNVVDNVTYRGNVQADVRARAGYAFGNILPFVAIGYSFERGTLVDTATGSQRGRVPLDAFTAGGGIDYRVSERVSVRLEDVYDFGSTRKQVDLNGTNTSVTRDGNTVRAGIAYHFE